MYRPVRQMMETMINTYGKEHWGHKTYPSNVSMIHNYITGAIGDTMLKDCTTKFMSDYFEKLKMTKKVGSPGHKADPGLVSNRMINDIYSLLDIAFKQQVAWEEIPKVPLDPNCRPTAPRGKRESLDSYAVKKALPECDDFRLFICVNLALGCSMREGEIAGLQWPRVHLNEDKDFEGAWLYVDRELARIDKDSYEILERKKDAIQFIFPQVTRKDGKVNKTILVLKEPKTPSSVRIVYIPKTIAKLLYQLKKEQEAVKRLFGKDYQDFGLVIAIENGRPMERKTIRNRLAKFLEAAQTKQVDFHSLRHTSVSTKLVTSKGDIKAVQGDTGHSQSKMVTDTYAEIQDKRRLINAKQFDQEFYGDIQHPFFEQVSNSHSTDKQASTTVNSEEQQPKQHKILRGNAYQSKEQIKAGKQIHNNIIKISAVSSSHKVSIKPRKKRRIG